MSSRLLLCVMVTTLVVAVVKARIGFQKDLNMDVVFPGPVTRSDPGIPEGHMRPLGWQRMTDGPVKEVEGAVSTIEFYNEYVSKEKPIVMRKALPENAPVFENWKEDSYILKQHGDVNISVRVKTGRRHGKIQSEGHVMTMKKFLEDYKYEEWYLSSVLPASMMEEMPLPSCVKCGTISERLWSSQLWMSSGGTSSRVHSHDDHLLHCVLFGRRDFIMIQPYHKKNFDFVPDYSGSIGGHSEMNTKMVDMFKFPQIARIPWTWSTLKPGDCIFVPAGYVHQVRSYGRSISITIEFSPLKFFDDTGCTLDDEDFAPLSVATFYWAINNGLVTLSNKNLNAESLRNLLWSLAGKGDVLSYKKFDHFYAAISANSTRNVPPSHVVFEMLTQKKGSENLSEFTLLNMPEKDLSRVAEIFNSFVKKDKHKGARKPARNDAKVPPTKRDEF